MEPQLSIDGAFPRFRGTFPRNVINSNWRSMARSKCPKPLLHLWQTSLARTKPGGHPNASGRICSTDGSKVTALHQMQGAGRKEWRRGVADISSATSNRFSVGTTSKPNWLIVDAQCKMRLTARLRFLCVRPPADVHVDAASLGNGFGKPLLAEETPGADNIGNDIDCYRRHGRPFRFSPLAPTRLKAGSRRAVFFPAA